LPVQEPLTAESAEHAELVWQVARGSVRFVPFGLGVLGVLGGEGSWTSN